MSELYELPEGWEWKKLDDAFVVKDGTHDSPKYIKENGYPLFTSKNLKDYGIDKTNFKSINKDDYVKINKRSKVDKGDLLFAMIGTIGNPTIIDFEPNFAIKNVALFKPKSIENTIELLKYYLSSNTIIHKMLTEAKGATQKFVGLTYLRQFPFPLIPLQEQKRIVAKLDSLFAKIDQAIALHQQNIDKANALMGSVLNEVFGELEERYELDSIGNMIEILTDYHSNGAYKTLKANVELLNSKDYALMIRATDLENNDYENNVKYITEKAYNFMSKSKVYGGEIILPKIGTIGSVYFMPYLNRPVSLAMNIFMIRCSSNVDNKYLFSYLKSPKGYNDIINRANGAVTKTITKDAVKSIKLPFPPLKTQQKTVTYLDQLSQKTEKLKQTQQEKMQSLKDLKASLLNKAFRGEL